MDDGQPPQPTSPLERLGRFLLASACLLSSLSLGLWFFLQNTQHFRAPTPHSLAWPFGSPWMGLLLWAPTLMSAMQFLRAPSMGRGKGLLPAIAVLSLELWLTMQPEARSSSLAWLRVLPLGVNLISLMPFLKGNGVGKAARSIALFSALWLVLTANALLNRLPVLESLPGREAPSQPPSYAQAIGLRSSSESPTSSWTSEIPPASTPRGQLHFLSSRTLSDAERADFVSSIYPGGEGLLRIQITGYLKTPDCRLFLRTESGRELEPLGGDFESPDRWRQIHFENPGEAFRLVARARSSEHWFAFTEPLAIGKSVWLSEKLARQWSWFTATALLCLVLWLWGQGKQLRKGTLLGVWAEAGFAKRWFPLLALCGYVLFFSQHHDPTAGPNDSGGYLNSARLLAGGHLAGEPRALPPGAPEGLPERARFTTTFLPSPDGRMAPEYPSGFPLEVAAAAQVLPFDTAVRSILILQLALGPFFTWRLARACALSAPWAFVASALVALCPVYLFQGLQPQSDGPALVWITAAMAWAISSKKHPRHALLSGLAASLAVLLRPANALCLLPLLVFFCTTPKRLLAWALAGAPAALFLLYYNHSLFGSAFTTGYGDISTAFGLRFLTPTLEAYARYLPYHLSPLILLSPLGLFARNLGRDIRFLLGSTVLLFLCFYSVYWCTYDNWYNMRFVLPIAPALLVLALVAFRSFLLPTFVFETGSLRARVMLGLACAAALFLLCFPLHGVASERVLYWIHNNQRHEVGAKLAAAEIPAGSLVLTKQGSNSLWHYTSLSFALYDKLPANSGAYLDACAQRGIPIFAYLYEGELNRDGTPKLAGHWRLKARAWGRDISIWERLRAERSSLTP